jgi:hypothetical protein
MLFTHVGSLPFLNTEDALDFTFDFDIPVLFTLPMMEPKEFMHLEMISNLGIGEFSENKIKFNDLDINSSFEIKSQYEEPFFKRFKSSGCKRFKYQQTGPVTLFELSDKALTIDQIFDYLLVKFTQLLVRYRDYGQVLFIIDEPMLNINFSKYRDKFNLFLEALSKLDGVEIGVHICSKMSVEELNELRCKYIHFDSSLYTPDEFSEITNTRFFGVSVPDNTNEYIASKSSYFLQNAEIISPSCGLALKNIKTIYNNIEYLKSITKLTLV